MKGLALLFIIIVFVSSCSKNGESGSKDKTMLLGKWEADYSVYQNDTVFYKAGSLFPCAYAVLPLEYNSGFEFNSESKGELIWCGGNKGQFFDWNYEKPNLVFNFNDKISTLKVSDLAEKSMNLYQEQKKIKYHLVKTE